MNLSMIRQACLALGMVEPISVELDGTVWLGLDEDRTYPDMKPILKKVAEMEAQKKAAKESAYAKLEAIGLNVDEIRALLS